MNNAALSEAGKPPEHRQDIADSMHAPPEWCRISLAIIDDAVITTDMQGRITFLNSNAESLTGWTLGEAAERPLEEVYRVVNERSRKPSESPSVQALRDGVGVGLTNPCLLIAKDGAECVVDHSAAPILDSRGVAGVVLVFRDISERRRQEQQIQEALTLAESIIRTLRQPFLVLDKGLRVRTANAAFYRTFHVSREETEGRFVYDLGDGQWNIPRLRVLLEDVLPQNHSFEDYGVEHFFPGIGKKVMVLNGRRFESGDSRPELILLAIEDITERRQVQVAVQASEVRYRRLFETAKDGILILDPDTGKILDANPFMTDLLGYTAGEFLGKELWEIGLFKDKSENEAAFRDLQQHNYVRYDYLPLESKAGRRVQVEFVSNVYLVDQQRVAQCNIRDISERSRLERQTREQATELSDLHRRKDEFLAILSHELRNPLAPILNAVQLLRLQQRNENLIQQQARIIIERQVGLLKHLVDDLLEISRITTGRVQLRKELVAVSGIVQGALETVRPLVEQRKHDLQVSQPPEPIWLDADAARLEQVVVNLLTNAAKYTPEGGRIWLTVQEEANACVLRVRDTGPGIAPELLPRIFDLFTQAEQTLARSQGGLGIGLALVKRLTELHGGTVAAYSAAGQGCEFVVRLPVASTIASPRSLPETQKSQSIKQALRVLVVDDNVDTAESLALLVKASGHDVHMVHDGLSVLPAALEYRPGVVLLDIGLPGLNGHEAAKLLRREPALQGVVLVAITGYGQETDRQNSLVAGFDHHLVKPVDFKNVQHILAALSSKSKG